MARRKQARRGNNEGSVYKTTERGKMVWIGQATDPQEVGPAKRRTVRGKSYKEAKGKLDKLKKEIQDGTVADTELTVSHYLLHRWLPQKRLQVKARTAELYAEQAARYVIPRLGMVRLDRLTPLKIQAMMGDVAKNVGTNAANKARTMLCVALGQAVRWQLLGRNPVEATERLKETPKQPVVWEPSDAVRFLETAKGHRLYALFYLAAATGLRRGELLGLRWQDVSHSVAHVRQALTLLGGRPIISTPKTERGMRQVTLSSDALAELEQHRVRQGLEREHLAALDHPWPDHGLVFTSEVGTPIHPRNLERTWYELQRRAGVPKIRLHDLRHLNVSIRRRLGQDVKLIADQIGHSNPTFTVKTYTHLFADDRQAAGVSLTDLLAPRGEPN